MKKRDIIFYTIIEKKIKKIKCNNNLTVIIFTEKLCHEWMIIYIHVCIYVCMYVCMYIYVYVYICVKCRFFPRVI